MPKGGFAIPPRRETLALLREMGFRSQPRRGQNFLFDPQLLEAFLDDAGVDPGERILEIGAGCGCLTQHLLSRGCEVLAVEIDPRLCEFISQHLRTPALRLLETDALARKSELHPDLVAALGRWDEPYRLVANLPYAIATPLLHGILETRPPLRGFGVLVQRELGDRWFARPGTRDYGPTSVLLALAGRGRVTRAVGRRLFTPPPAVDSVFCVWEATEMPPGRESRAAVRLARRLFLHRRKMLRSLLAPDLGPEDPFWREPGRPRPDERPENVTPVGFVALARALEGGEDVRGTHEK